MPGRLAVCRPAGCLRISVNIRKVEAVSNVSDSVAMSSRGGEASVPRAPVGQPLHVVQVHCDYVVPDCAPA